MKTVCRWIFSLPVTSSQ